MTMSKRVSGQVLLLLLLLLLGTALLALFSPFDSSPTAVGLRRQQHSSEVLAEAREALLAQTVLMGVRPLSSSDFYPYPFGALPCPQSNSTGSTGSFSGTMASGCATFETEQYSLGRLPWKSLQLSLLQDGSGSCLWYAVAKDYRYSRFCSPKDDTQRFASGLYGKCDAARPLFNPDWLEAPMVVTDSGRDVDQVLALVFAPGVATAQQNRSINSDCSGGMAEHFLEGVGNGGTFAQMVAGAGHHQDRIAYITTDRLWQGIEPLLRGQLLPRLADCLVQWRQDKQVDILPSAVPWPVPSSQEGDDAVYKEPVAATGYGLFPRHFADGTSCADYGVKGALHKLWQDWKDHFFYFRSADFAASWTADTPGDEPAYKPQASGQAGKKCVGIDTCHELEGEPVAAVVIYAGRATAEQRRGLQSQPAVTADLALYLAAENSDLDRDFIAGRADGDVVCTVPIDVLGQISCDE